jgi:hypothetical protein
MEKKNKPQTKLWWLKNKDNEFWAAWDYQMKILQKDKSEKKDNDEQK